MGGGSNLLFSSSFDGLIIHPNIPGVVEEHEDRSYTYLEAGAGVEWDELVGLSVMYGLGGLENLSLIPGAWVLCRFKILELMVLRPKTAFIK